ncbi:MAG TPA: DUF5985 family protein [Pirellulales bacterium]|nr:DUF5985 family protein [Pirellulales bacterium]
MSATQDFLLGMIAMGCAIASLYFLRFWRTTGDRLFLIFGVAFFVMGCIRVALGCANELGLKADEHSVYLYVLRLVAFLLIVVAIIDKNRPRSTTPQ